MADLRAEVVLALNERSAQMVANRLEREYANAGDRAGRAFSNNLEGNHLTTQGAQAGREYSTGFSTTATAGIDTFTRDFETRMRETHARIARSGEDAGQDFSRAWSNGMDSATRSSGGFISSVEGMGQAVAGLGRVGGPAAIGVLAGAIGGLAGVASAASGVIGLIPAVAGGAVAAFGTLKIATLGVSDALENLGDTEKFNEALRALTPNARDAMVSIRGLMPAFDELRNSTQNALFANMGPQIEQLSAQFMPAIQQMTTGIAGAFNSMFSGVTAQLMTPETSAALEGITTNIASAFEKIAPAAASMTDAFTSLTSVGASFLPALADAASGAAASFAQFITEAAKSGQLQQWIETGMDMMRQLGAATMNVLEAFMSMAPVGERVMPAIVSATELLVDLMPVLNALIVPITPLFDMWAPAIDGASGAVSTLMGVMSPLLTTVSAIADAWAYIRGDDGPKGGRELRAPGTAAPGTPGTPGSAAGSPFGGVGGGAGMPSGVGGVGGQGIGDISQWSGSRINNGSGASGGAAGGADMPVAPYGGDPMSLLQGYQVDASLYSAAGSVLDAQQRNAQAEATLNALLQSNSQDAEKIQKARNDVARSDRELFESELRLNEAKKSSTEAFTNTVGKLSSDLGAAIDPDFGISKGLGGIVENAVKALGNALAAPFLQALGMVEQANPNEGSGMVGMLAANGTFGSQYTPGAVAASNARTSGTAGYSGGGGGGSYAAPGGAYPGDAALLANVPAGRYGQDANRNLLEGLSDCSSSIGDLVAILDGQNPNTNANLTTGNAASMLPGMGFVRGQGGPGDFRIGYNGGHMQATLPGGTPWNWGGDDSAANRGVGGTGADDPAFTDHWFRPAGAVAAPGGGLTAPSLVSPGGPSTNTSPGLTPGLPGVPGMPGGGMPGMGMPQSGGPRGGGGGMAYPSQGGNSGNIMGGMAMDGLMAATAGLDMMMPGAGAAAKIGIQLANRTIGYAAQNAGILASGIGETLSIGDNPRGSIGSSWLGKLAGGIAGAAPALPNIAGGKPPGPMDKAGGGQGGNTNISGDTNINVKNEKASEDQTGKVIAEHQAAMQAPAGRR